MRPADRRKRITRNDQLHKTAKALLVRSETVGKGFQSSPKDQEFQPGNPETAHPDGKLAMTKKQKRGLRRDSLKQRLGITASSYSKSHRKRLKRKAAEQLSTDFKSMERAIMAVDNESVNTTAVNVRIGQIGEGKDSSLTAKQRQRTFQVENLRHKAILNTPEFTSNPFQTIRTHAQNTLVKHQ